MTELERLRVVIEAETKPLQNELKRVNKSLGGLEKTTNQTASRMKASFAKIAVGVAAVGYAAKKAVTSIASIAKESQAVQAQTANLSKALGSSAQDYISWAKKGASAYGISEAAAIQYGNTYGAMASLFEKDSNKVGSLTQAMMQTSAVVASKTGRTMDDVLDRIRSGLMGNTEAIEDLNIFVNQSAITQTEAYKKMAGTASWNQLTMSQQKAILYYGILEQANTRYGTSIDPVMQKQLQLSAQLANLRTNLGNAFLPVVNVIIPILQHLVGWLNTAATYVRAFFELLFGPQPSGPMESAEASSSNIASNMGSATNSAEGVNTGMNKAAKAAQKIKSLLAGFDELNILSEGSSDAGGSAGGGGISLPSTPNWGMEGLETSANSFTSAFKDISTTVEEAKASLQSFWEKTKEIFGPLIPLLAGVAAGFVAFKGLDYLLNFGDTFAYLTGPLKFLNPLLEGLSGIVKGLLAPLGTLGSKIMGLGLTGDAAATSLTAITGGFAAVAAVVGLVIAALVSFYQKSEEFRNIVSTAVQGVIDIFTSLWEGTIKPIFDAVVIAAQTVWEYGIKPLWDSFVDFIGAIATLLLNIWNSILQPIVNWFVSTLGPIIATVIGAVVLVFGGLLAATGTIFSAILDILTAIINWIAGFFQGTWKDVLGRIGGFFTGLWNTVTAVVGWLWDILKSLIGWVTATFGPAFKVGLDFVVNVFKNIWNTISGIVGGIITTIKGIITFITGVFTGNWSKAWDGVKGIFGGIWDGIKSLVSGAWDFILGLFNTGGKIFDGIVGAISGVFKTIVNSLISGINLVIATPFNVINGLLNTIRGIGVLGIKPFKGLWNYNPLPVPQIPKLATGTNYVQREGLAYIHEGEAVVPKKYNPAADGGGAEQIVLLQEQNSLLRRLLEKDSGVYLDGKEITDSTVKNIKQRERLTGKPVFGL